MLLRWFTRVNNSKVPLLLFVNRMSTMTSTVAIVTLTCRARVRGACDIFELSSGSKMAPERDRRTSTSAHPPSLSHDHQWNTLRASRGPQHANLQSLINALRLLPSTDHPYTQPKLLISQPVAHWPTTWVCQRAQKRRGQMQRDPARLRNFVGEEQVAYYPEDNKGPASELVLCYLQ